MSRSRHNADQFLDTVAGLLELRRAGKLPALYVDADVIRVAWPAEQQVATSFRFLSLTQADRLLAGEPIETVLDRPRRQLTRPRRLVKPPAWQDRREAYLLAKAS